MSDSLARLPLDIYVPSYALKRRFGISFCSSSSYLTEPRFERRDAVSFERNDRNAIYIRMLGDVKLRTNPDIRQEPGKLPAISPSDQEALYKLATSPEQQPRLRTRFLSVSKHRRRTGSSQVTWSPDNRSLVDQSYHTPTRLLLSRLGDWNFNVFTLEGLSGGRSLFQVAHHLFHTYDFIRVFHLDFIRLMQFFTLVEQNYHGNPYHNAVHAADVAHAMHCYLQEKEVFESTTDLEKMAALVAALTHDLDHPGVNNTFLIATSNHLATLYHNSSVLENHHWRSAVGLLQETGVVAHLTKQQRDKFLQQLQSLILATDITRQQEFLLRFCRYIESGDFQYHNNEEQRYFLLQIALKCADISNPCRPWRISQRWSKRICHEFFLQGDMERALNVAVTPLCDRLDNTVASIQQGFIQYVVSPLFKAWDRFLGTELSALMMSHLTYNQNRWKSILDTGQAVSELDVNLGEVQLDEFTHEESATGREVVKSSLPLDVVESMAANAGMDSGISQRTATAMEEEQAENEEEEEEGGSEEDDVVENDVNLIYHYQNESEESGRGLSPVSEDSESGVPFVVSIRRSSLPPVVRRDLNFFLGLRKDPMIPLQQSRRQSLPTTVTFFHSSSGRSSAKGSPSPRSLSMDALLARPRISNLSPTFEVSSLESGDPLSFTPLKHQTLMLQGSSLTRFVINAAARRGSCGPSFPENGKSVHSTNLTPDLIIPSIKNHKHDQNLASSWPTLVKRNTTNGSSFIHAPSNSSTQSISNKSSPSVPSDDQLFTD